ncbi:MAG: hypothetical protein IJ466_02880 [Clostridia bacterium]|nr:hypothetical protein [Clostridia bacterium]
MKKSSAAASFLARFQDILDDMDEFEMTDELEELNAQFEDAIFLLESIDEDDEDASEELEGALEEIGDILDGYRDLSEEMPDLKQKVLELEMAVKMAEMNLK